MGASLPRSVSAGTQPGVVLLAGRPGEAGGAGRAGKGCASLASAGHAPWAGGTEMQRGFVTGCGVYWYVLEEPGSALR